MKGMGAMRAVVLAAAGLGFSGAQRLDAKSLMSESRVEASFDPNALFRAAAESSFGRSVNRLLSRGGKVKQRRNAATNWRNAPNHRKTAREQRNELLGRNIGRIDYHAERMRWLERNAHVVAKRDRDQERAGRMWPPNYRNSRAPQ
jgi:hypothetical protein